MCLPRCPTYLETRDERESPRGRISLMRGLASGALQAAPGTTAHLDRCLGCRACEAVCPSGVPYGSLLDDTRSLLRAGRPLRSWSRILLDQVLMHPKRLRRLTALLRLYERSGAQGLARWSRFLGISSLRRLEALLRPLQRPQPYAELYPAVGPERGRVALFLGCVAQELDRETLGSAIRLLTHLGYAVHIPPAQGCCGALHLHLGDRVRADALARCNVEAFASLPAMPVLWTASGCGAALKEYAREASGHDAQSFASRTMDVSEFLSRIPWPQTPALRPFRARVAVHDPCSLRHVLKSTAPTYQLLRRLPEAEVVALGENEICCGSAGAYLLTQPVLAERLLHRKLRQVDAARPQLVATSNVGCALQLAGGMRRTHRSVEVLHPVTLLARQLAE